MLGIINQPAGIVNDRRSTAPGRAARSRLSRMISSKNSRPSIRQMEMSLTQIFDRPLRVADLLQPFGIGEREKGQRFVPDPLPLRLPLGPLVPVQAQLGSPRA